MGGPARVRVCGGDRVVLTTVRRAARERTVAGVAAITGAIGFLTRIPVGHDERAWMAFRAAPATLPLVGYLVGPLVAVSFVRSLPGPTAALAFVVAIYLVTGINHVDGVADLGDAAAVHGSAEVRRAAMKDTDTGVGAVLAVILTVSGLALAGLALAELPVRAAVGLVVAAEVGAKFGMAAVAALGSPSHDGLGSQLAARAGPRSLVGSALVALPAVVLGWPTVAGAGAVLAGLTTALLLVRWAHARLDGVGGDVFGAANELGRVAALHVGVILWMHW